MRRLIGLITFCLLAVVTTAFAAEPRYLLVQHTPPEPGPVEGGIIVTSDLMPAKECCDPLYKCVKYRGECKMHPCAVPMVVMVKDPCWRKDRCDPCDTPDCVAVKICVPPCSVCPPKVTCRRNSGFVRYDFGKYAVTLRSHRNGTVTVDYSHS